MPTVSRARRTVLSSTLLLAGMCLSDATGQMASSEHTLTFEEGAPAPTAAIEDVVWLIGRWEGEGLGGAILEQWMRTDATTMTAMFAAVGEDGVTFYELVTLTEEAGTLIMRLKHFNADLTGWEEKDDTEVFPLVKLEGQTAYFDGLTYELDSSGRLNVHVVVGGADGTRSELGLTLRRVAH